MDNSMDIRVQTILIMLMMLSLAFFIYVFMIPAQYIRLEHDNYGANITEAEDVVAVGDRTANERIVRRILITATVGTVILFAVLGFEHKVKKKAQESNPIPEAEESAEHHE